MLTETNIC